MHFPGVALVVGAASGIGKATALQYAAEGCLRIAIADIQISALEQVQSEIQNISHKAIVKTLKVDVTSLDSVQAMVDAVVKQFCRIDYCANVAGIIEAGDTVNLSPSTFDKVYEVNLRGVFYCCRAEIAQMLKQTPLTSNDSTFPARGAICNVSSQAGLMGNGNLPSYVATKHGVVGLSKSDGAKYASQGIRVNALCPGSIETPMLGHLPGGEEGKRRATERVQEIAMGRVGQPAEMAQCIMFLTSGRSSFVTATTLAAHGGIRNQ
ncbi:NAD(P)-binding protein [Aspergillus sergii]|uniref:NAD(P)-binding protein n=1 Tax=Aspergillus sergii TaxID=1034303 RepID=A0A5N6XDU3_9EURO|nr:NAD(P)-binding protein [Aspergillus sergii]